MKPGGLFSKLFMGSYFFTIALREKTPQSIMDNRSFHAQTIMPATKDDWAADPMLVEDGKRTWLFYEAVKNGNLFFLPKEYFQYKPNAKWDKAYEYALEILTR